MSNTLYEHMRGIAKNGYDGLTNSAFNVVKVESYLYEMNVDSLDYDYAKEYFRHSHSNFNGSCSAICKGNYYGRNFDWTYGSGVEFVVYTKAHNQFHATMGVSGELDGLTREVVERGASADLYRMVPFMLADGINDAGVVCSMNISPKDFGKTTGTTPTEDHLETICALMLPRYILDRFVTATEAVDYISNHVSIYSPESMDEEVQIMVADLRKTYSLSFAENKLHVLDISDKAFMTNFNLYEVEYNEDGSVCTPECGDARTTNHISPYGSGLERYNLINAAYSSLTSRDAMREILRDLFYTNTYKRETEPFWHSEFVGGSNTVLTPAVYFKDIEEKCIVDFENRTRGEKNTWQTNHSVVYDISSRSMRVITQEGAIDHVFDLLNDVIITSPNGSRYKLVVTDDGTLTTVNESSSSHSYPDEIVL